MPGIELSTVVGSTGVGNFFVRFPAFFVALELSDDETDNLAAILSHTFVGLHREGLIDVHWHFSTDRDDLGNHAVPRRSFPSGGVIFGLSMFGIELFCVAHGIATSRPVRSPGRRSGSSLK
jgi:hypothetical protein